MAAVVEQRQETRGESRERPDRQNDGEHHEGAGAERLDAQVDPGWRVGWRIAQRAQGHERADEQHDSGNQDRVVDDLAPVPLHRRKADAHFAGSGISASTRVFGSIPAGGSGGGRFTSAIVKPKATRTRQHRPEQTMDVAVSAGHRAAFSQRMST